MPYAAALLVALAIVAGAEWSTDEDMFTMLTIIVASASLGWLRPRQFALSGIAVGLVVPAIAVASQLTDVHPAYETATEAASHGARYAASLLLLVVPACVAAFVGRLAGSRVRTVRNRAACAKKT
jgi:hypothetical protein